MNTKLLEDIGLTKSEIKVYLALLELGSATSGPIVEKSGASSSKIYEILEKLMQKGLASFIIKAGTKHFEATDPERLMDYINEKESKITEQKQELRSIIPELELKKKLKEHKSEATIFKGIKGVETAYNDILKTMRTGEEYYVFGSMEPTEPYFTFIQRYHKKRAAKGIKVRLLHSKDTQEWAEKVKGLPNTEVKFAPPQLVTSSFVVIYANKTLIVVGTKKDLTLFRIENKEVAESFKSQFDILWNQEVAVYQGLEEIKTIFRKTLECKETWFIGGKGYIAERDPAFFFKEYVPEAQKTHHHWKNLAQPGKIVPDVATLSFAETRYLPQTYITPHVIFIFGDYVANVLWEKEPLAYLIHDKNIAKSYRDYFELLWNQEQQTLKGFDGIKELCNRVLKEEKDLYLIGANGVLYERHTAFFHEFDKKRIERGIKRHHLSIQAKRNAPFNICQNTEVHYLPAEFNSPMVIWIFGDNVANILWDDELIYITKNQKIADDYRKYFQLVWNTSSP